MKHFGIPELYATRHGHGALMDIEEEIIRFWDDYRIPGGRKVPSHLTAEDGWRSFLSGKPLPGPN